MLVETVAFAATFIVVYQAPGVALVSAGLVFLIRARKDYHAQCQATNVREMQAESEPTTSPELQEHLSTLAWNRALTEELYRAYLDYSALTTKMQETQAESEATISELRKQLFTVKPEEAAVLAPVQEAQAKSGATTIAELQERLSALEEKLQSASSLNRVLAEELYKEYLERALLGTSMQEAQTKSETTIAELQKQMSTLEAELQSISAKNSALTGENEKMQETQTKSEKTIADLQKQSSTLQAKLQSTSAQNRALTGENEKMQEAQTKSKTTIIELQKRLSTPELQSTRSEKMQETQVESRATIAELRKHLLTLELELRSTSNWNQALIRETTEYMTRIAADTQAREVLSLEVTQAKANALALQKEVEAKKKEAKDWKDLYLHYSTSPNHRQAIQRGDTVSVSVADIIADKDKIIDQLRDRLTECYSQLTRTSVPGAATL